MPELTAIKQQKCNVFIVYDRVLKDPDTFILRQLEFHYRSKFEEYLDFSKLDDISDKYIQAALIMRREENPFTLIAKKKFDMDLNYTYLHKKFKNMYRDSAKLAAWHYLDRFVHNYCVGKIYVWNPEPDERQMYDLATNTNRNTKIEYITGNYRNAIQQTNPGLIYDWSAKRIAELVDDEEYNHVRIGISNYFFNFVGEDIQPDGVCYLKYDLSYRENIGYFKVLNAEPTVFYNG